MDTQDISIYGLPIFNDNYIWLIIAKNEHKVIAIDPGEAASLLKFLKKNKLNLAAILITHHHLDHIGGIKELVSNAPVDVYGPKNPAINGINKFVQEPDLITFPFLKNSLSVMDIPGHTLDHIAYLFSDMLFCGDTLFSAGCGRIFEGSPALMFNSLQKIVALPDATQIYCTHEYTLQNLRFAQLVEPRNRIIQDKIREIMILRDKNMPSLPTRLIDEKKINPFLRCDSQEIIASVEKHAGIKLNTTLDVFTHLRQWKDNFS